MEKNELQILIVDPEPKDRHLISSSLERSKVPAKVTFEKSVRKALGRLAKERIDVVLADHAPPEENAYHLLQAMQQKGLLVPVIVIAQDGEPQAIREAFKRGAEDYVLKEELELISLFDVIGSAIERRRQREEAEQARERLKQMAERDGLTGLYNHRHLLETIEKEFARAKRYYRPLALLMIDLDGFKSINDTCGHLQGDEVLRQVARLIGKSVRSVDLIARYGGDEFVILLPETLARAAIKIGERIREEIGQTPYVHEGRVFPLSVSIGVATFHPSMPSAGSLLKEADEALYVAKRNGRSQVVYKRSEGLKKKAISERAVSALSEP